VIISFAIYEHVILRNLDT